MVEVMRFPKHVVAAVIFRHDQSASVFFIGQLYTSRQKIRIPALSASHVSD